MYFAVLRPIRARAQVAEGDRCSYSYSVLGVFDYDYEHRYAEHEHDNTIVDVFMKYGTRLCLKSPSWARGRAIFLPGKDGEAGDIFFIVDGAGCSQTKKGPTEARATFQTEPSLRPAGR